MTRTAAAWPGSRTMSGSGQGARWLGRTRSGQDAGSVASPAMVMRSPHPPHQPPPRARGRRCSDSRCRAQHVSCSTAYVIVCPTGAPAAVTRPTRGRACVDDRAVRSAARALGVLPRCVRHLQTHVNRGGLAGRPARSPIGLCSLRRASSVERAASCLQRKARWGSRAARCSEPSSPCKCRRAWIADRGSCALADDALRRTGAPVQSLVSPGQSHGLPNGDRVGGRGPAAVGATRPGGVRTLPTFLSPIRVPRADFHEPDRLAFPRRGPTRPCILWASNSTESLSLQARS